MKELIDALEELPNPKSPVGEKLSKSPEAFADILVHVAAHVGSPVQEGSLEEVFIAAVEDYFQQHSFTLPGSPTADHEDALTMPDLSHVKERVHSLQHEAFNAAVKQYVKEAVLHGAYMEIPESLEVLQEVGAIAGPEKVKSRTASVAGEESWVTLRLSLIAMK